MACRRAAAAAAVVVMAAAAAKAWRRTRAGGGGGAVASCAGGLVGVLSSVSTVLSSVSGRGPGVGLLASGRGALLRLFRAC